MTLDSPVVFVSLFVLVTLFSGMGMFVVGDLTQSEEVKSLGRTTSMASGVLLVAWLLTVLFILSAK